MKFNSKVVFASYLLISFFSIAEDPMTMPIADVHLHVYDCKKAYINPNDMLEKLERNNVKWAGGVGDGGNKILRQKLGDRYISAFGQCDWTGVFVKGGNEALEDLSNFSNFISDFEDGDFNGVGEIHTKSYGRLARSTPIDGPVLTKIYEYLNEKNGWIQMHRSYDPKSENLKKMISTFKKYPNVKFILSHCLGTKKAGILRKIFENTDNTFCEISAEGPIKGVEVRVRDRENIYGYQFNSGIRKNWKQLMNDYPDRIMLGTDTCCNMEDHYDGIIENLRKLVLSNLEEPTRSKIAYKNALKIFNLPE